MSDTFDPYHVPHRPSWAVIGKDPRSLSLIVREMPATKTRLPATGYPAQLTTQLRA